MSEHEKAEHGEPRPWWEKIASGYGQFHTGVEALQALEISQHVGKLGSGWSAMSKHAGHVGLSNILAPFSLVSGVQEMVHGHTGYEKLSGGLEALSGGIGTLGLLGAGATAVGGSGGALAATGAALTGASATLAPVGALAGAASWGLGIGTMFDRAYQAQGLGGKNADGSNRSFIDESSDHAVHAEEYVSEKLGGGELARGVGWCAGAGTSILESFGGMAMALADAPALSLDMIAGGPRQRR